VPRRSGGSHRKWLNPATGATMLPDWERKDLKEGTLHGAVRRLGIDWQEFLKA
jgi:predicted RNA binding protein YcfA (HicA-like mRNA interferase family)